VGACAEQGRACDVAAPECLLHARACACPRVPQGVHVDACVRARACMHEFCECVCTPVIVGMCALIHLTLLVYTRRMYLKSAYVDARVCEQMCVRA